MAKGRVEGMAAKANVHNHIVFSTHSSLHHELQTRPNALRHVAVTRSWQFRLRPWPLAAMSISNLPLWATEPASTNRAAIICGLAVVCAAFLLYIITSSFSRPMPANSMSRPRRTSSNLGGDPRGDTGVPSMASYLAEKNRRDLNVPSVRLTPIAELSES